MHRREHVPAGLVHEVDQVIPVINLLEREFLDRSPGDYHAVELLVLDVLETGIELLQMRKILHLAVVRLHHYQNQVDLKRSVCQHAHQLDLSGLERRHQIQDTYLQRTDLLLTASGVGHDEHTLSPELV